jgi:anti-anti-sigma factor
MSELIEREVVEGGDAGLKDRGGPAAVQPRVMRVVLEGELGPDDHRDISRLLFRLTQAHVHRIVIDLRQVTHFDYRGVRPLMRQAEIFRALGGDLRLCGLSPYLFAIFQAAGASEAFDYHATQQAAVDAFSGRRFPEGR